MEKLKSMGSQLLMGTTWTCNGMHPEQGDIFVWAMCVPSTLTNFPCKGNDAPNRTPLPNPPKVVVRANKIWSVLELQSCELRKIEMRVT